MHTVIDCKRFREIFLFGIFSALLVQAVLGGPGQGPKWGYYEAEREQQPDLWKFHFLGCSGKQQSPIALRYANTKIPREAFDEFQFYRSLGSVVNSNIEVKNNGHTVVFTPSTDYYVEGAGLYGKYKVAQFHLHWGQKGNRGSEHTLDDVQYAAEIHFVMHSNSYSGIGEALGKLGGIAVLGVFVKEVNGAHNPYFSSITRNLRQVAYPESPSTQIPGFELNNLLPRNTNVFYRYKGSLTTPPCTERLTWTVFDEPITVSKAQMQVLRTTLKHHGKIGSGQKYETVTDNYRPVQDLYKRTVYISQRRP